MTDARLPIAVLGAAGRMGQALVTALEVHARLRLGASIYSWSDLADLADLAGSAVAIDFTTAEAAEEHIYAATDRRMPLVLGTTGLGEQQLAILAQCAKTIPIVQSANMSVGVNLLAALVQQTAEALGPEYDIEILEMHHRRKKDAPSGTALLLGEAAASGSNLTLADLRTGTDRNGARLAGEIGFATLRGGDVAGDHTVFFAGEGERLELTHRATSRAVFAQGALRAAEWLIGRAPGLYTMRDVLRAP